MKRTAKWIRHTHILRKDEFECSVCGAKTDIPKKNCPNCGRMMKGLMYDPSWVDEISLMDESFGDD